MDQEGDRAAEDIGTGSANEAPEANRETVLDGSQDGAATDSAEVPTTGEDQSGESASEPANGGECPGEIPPAGETGTGEILAALNDGISVVREDFRRQFNSSEIQERRIDALHQELQDYRGDLVAKALRPIVTRLIRFHDDIGKLMEWAAKSEEVSLDRDRVIQTFAGVAEDAELILRESDIEPFREGERGTVFDGRRQRAVGYVVPETADQIGLVAESVRPGFEGEEGVIQKERVKVFKGDPIYSNGEEKGDQAPPDDSEALATEQGIQ